MSEPNILRLPIYELLHIITFLDASSKYNLSRTCRYFEDIMNLPLVWNQGEEFTATCLRSKKEVKYLMKKIPKKTRKVWFRGKYQQKRYLPLNFFKDLCLFDNLTVLVLERLSFNEITSGGFGKLKCLGMRHFPPTLKELSLKGTTSIVNKNFLFSPEGRPNLKVIILDECHWLDNYHLSCLISYPNLEIISLIGCLTQQPLWFSYLFNVAWNIKILDVRLANVDDGILSRNLNLRHFAIFPVQSLQCVYFENSALVNQGTRVLRLCAAMLNQTVNFTPPYRSSLYIDPIPECTCGYEKASKQLSVSTNNIDPVRMKLTLRNFKFVDLECISSVKLDVLDLSGSITDVSFILEQEESQSNCRIIHPKVCKCLVATPELSVDPPKGYEPRQMNTKEYEAFVNELYDTLVTIRPWSI